ACNRVYGPQESNDNSLADAMTEASHAAKRFYNQRNIILNRTHTLVLDLLKTEDELNTIKKEGGTNLKNEKDLKKENERLKKLLDQRNAEYLGLTNKIDEYEMILANRSNENKKS
ncbi:14518_t:CDS:2, partial [Entrophospora sp. SA101]